MPKQQVQQINIRTIGKVIRRIPIIGWCAGARRRKKRLGELKEIRYEIRCLEEEISYWLRKAYSWPDAEKRELLDLEGQAHSTSSWLASHPYEHPGVIALLDGWQNPRDAAYYSADRNFYRQLNLRAMLQKGVNPYLPEVDETKEKLRQWKAYRHRMLSIRDL